MAKSKSVFICQECGEEHLKWQGQCVACGEWNTLVEEVRESASKGRGLGAVKTFSETALNEKTVRLSEVAAAEDSRRRISTGIGEFDRVLGGEIGEVVAAGKSEKKLNREKSNNRNKRSSDHNKKSSDHNQGMVQGAVMLVGGEPGIGKSTILTQVVLHQLEGAGLTKQQNPKEVLTNHPIIYAAGEESPSQISLRINRILEAEQKNSSKNKSQVSDIIRDGLLFVTTTDVDEVVEIIKQKQPSLVIIDSVQTMTTSELTGAPGSVGQVRESADRLTDVAKRMNVPTFLVGHVTKEGSIAGPKTLEHIVDAVLELSGERTGQLRLLRAIKNRFGATDEVGVFKLDEVGLAEVSNPSEFFLEHADASVPGSATTCVMEGTRPLLIEVQALVNSSQLAMPRRVGRGVDVSRIQVLSAVLQKHARLPLGSHDIFLSAAGGYRVQEPGIDLGLAVALASSLQNKPLPKKSVFIGEVGLLGEIRGVSYLERRAKEAKRLGFKHLYSRETHRSVRELLKELDLLKK